MLATKGREETSTTFGEPQQSKSFKLRNVGPRDNGVFKPVGVPGGFQWHVEDRNWFVGSQ